MVPHELVNEIHSLDPSKHIVIGTILRKFPKIKLNENKNGIMVNVSTLPDEAIQEIAQYMDFLKTQQNILNKIEEETDECKRLIQVDDVEEQQEEEEE